MGFISIWTISNLPRAQSLYKLRNGQLQYTIITQQSKLIKGKLSGYKWNKRIPFDSGSTITTTSKLAPSSLALIFMTLTNETQDENLRLHHLGARQKITQPVTFCSFRANNIHQPPLCVESIFCHCHMPFLLNNETTNSKYLFVDSWCRVNP